MSCEMLNPRFHQKPRCPKMIAVDWPDCEEAYYNLPCRADCKFLDKKTQTCKPKVEYEQCEGHLEYHDFGYWFCDSCGSMIHDSELPEELELSQL